MTNPALLVDVDYKDDCHLDIVAAASVTNFGIYECTSMSPYMFVKKFAQKKSPLHSISNKMYEVITQISASYKAKEVSRHK